MKSTVKKFFGNLATNIANFPLSEGKIKYGDGSFKPCSFTLWMSIFHSRILSCDPLQLGLGLSLGLGLRLGP